ncbi:MAG TPA: TolC family protein [Saprospiraceae bacterium]|nr:TolC family protein [Saprospiraceae bacterium]
MYRKLFLSIVPLALSFVLTAQKTMSLSDAIEYAMNNHPDVRIAKLNVKDAEWRIKENKATALPQLSLGVTYSFFLQQPGLPAEALGFEGAEPGQKIKFQLRNNIAGKIEYNQLLFNNSYLVGLKAAKLYREYVELQLISAKEKVRNSITDAYLPALLISETVNVLDSNIQNQQKLFSDTKATYKAGFVEQLDVDRLDYLLSTLKTQRDNLVRQKETVINYLKFTLNIPVSEEIILADDLDALLENYVSINPDEALDYNNRPDYVTILKARELNQVQVDLYHKDWLPTVAFFASYNPSFQGNNKLFWIPSAVAGLAISMPIYDGGLSRAKQERAVIAAMQVDEQKNMLIRGLDLEIENARIEYSNAKQKVEDHERDLVLAQRIYDTTQIKFKAGVGSSYEVTQALAGLFQAQGALVNARFELLKAVVSINKALGKA